MIRFALGLLSGLAFSWWWWSPRHEDTQPWPRPDTPAEYARKA